MKNRKWLKPVLFTLGGAVAGLMVYFFAGRPTGAGAVASNPVSAVIYLALAGFLLSGAFGKESVCCRLRMPKKDS